MCDQASSPLSQDHFLGGRLVVRQPVTGYRAGSDPLFLAAAQDVRDEEQILDLGCGVGTASLALLCRVPGIKATGLDIQADLADIARQNGRANGLADRFQVVCGCASQAHPQVPYHQFHRVITNPPWYEPGSVRPPPTRSKSVGHMEGTLDLAGWLRQAVRFLRPKGVVSILHRADRLADILAAFAVLKVGEIRIQPLWPKPGQPASRVIVSARKDSKAPQSLLPGLILHHQDGAYTDQAQAVLRDGRALTDDPISGHTADPC